MHRVVPCLLYAGARVSQTHTLVPRLHRAQALPRCGGGHIRVMNENYYVVCNSRTQRMQCIM